MSRNPGIGNKYLDEYTFYHQKGLKFHATEAGGKKVPLPRYYVDKIFSKEQKEQNTIENLRRIEQQNSEVYDKIQSTEPDYDLFIENQKKDYVLKFEKRNNKKNKL
jgi:hypothetical protein